MRILFDIGHPGHVHLFKHLARRFQQDGWTVLFTARQKEHELALLEAEGLPYRSFGRHFKTLWGKLWGMIKFDFQMVRTILDFKPDLVMSHGSIYGAHACFFTGRPHLALEDSGNMEQILLYRPFTDVILTPKVLRQSLGRKQIRYDSYHEIAYLHPDYFEADEGIYADLHLNPGEPYALFRFVSWNATHDVGSRGLSRAQKEALVQFVAARMKVYISAESSLPESLKDYALDLPPERLHHALYHAAIVISEGTTIASEAGVLGTPAIYINPIERSYCTDQGRYGLVWHETDPAEIEQIVRSIIAADRQLYRQRAQRLIQEKEDLTQYLYLLVRDRYAAKVRRSGISEISKPIRG